MPFQILGDPHPWPNDPNTSVKQCALLIIDMQHDYCSPGYYMDKAGYDVNQLRKPITSIQEVLSVARKNGMSVIYTRQGRAGNPDQDGERTSSFPQTALRGEKGWEIVPEVAPQESETIIEKTTCSAFVSGELQRLLEERRINHLVFCGNTIDVCVHSTLRSAIDLGYECLLLSDCCGAVNDELHKWSIESVKVENGVFGTVATSRDFVRAFEGR